MYERSENESRKKTTSFSSYSMYDVLSVQLVLASHVRALSVDGDHDEADERQNERNVHGWHAEELAAVDYRSLERRQNATAEDRHDEASRTELGVVAQARERYAVDGGEHERHTCADAYQTVQTVDVLQEDYAADECAARNGERHKQVAGVDVTKQECADETRTAEDDHRNDVVLLRHHLGCLLGHALSHQYARAVLDDEGPAHDLNAYVEELRYHALSVVGQREDAAQRRHEVDVVVLVAVMRHLLEENEHEHGEDNDADGKVRTDEHAQVALLHRLKLCVVELCACRRVERTDLSLNEVHRHEHAQQRAHRVERLRKVQTACRCFLGSHRQDVRVRRCLEERQTARQYEVGDKERIVFARHLSRIEQQRAERIKTESDKHACLVAVAAYEHGCGERHSEVAAVERHLNKCAVGSRHAEDF